MSIPSQPSPVLTEVSVEELAIAVCLSTAIALLLTLTVVTITVYCVRHRRARRSFPLDTDPNVAYHSRSGEFTSTHESSNLPLPLPPRVIGFTNGATPNNENPSLGAMDNVAYGVLQNETESFNDVSVKDNISYGAYTEGEDYDYAIVS